MKIGGVRDRIRRLVRRRREAPLSEHEGIDQAIGDLEVEGNQLRRAENGRKRRAERKKPQKSFYQNPFKANKDWLLPSLPVKLEVEKEVLGTIV